VPSPAQAAPSLPTPMATSVETDGATWATIPMGDLSQLANTFWQLLYRPAGSQTWSNQVEATATATNGGLVLASGPGSLVVGVRPSLDLHFTPLIATFGGPSSWSDGLIAQALAARQSALAGTPADALALVAAPHGGSQVLADAGNLSGWHALLSEAPLAGTRPGEICGIGELTSVGFAGNEPLAGASCAKPGVIGLYGLRGGEWGLVPAVLPAQLRGGQAEVLAMIQLRATAVALVAVVLHRSTYLLTLSPNGRQGWSSSSPLALGRRQAVASSGPAGSGAVFVLVQEASGTELLATVAAGPGSKWQYLVAPPSGTETVAFVRDGTANAFVGKNTNLDIWSLSRGSSRWSKLQVMRVPIQFGSSS